MGVEHNATSAQFTSGKLWLRECFVEWELSKEGMRLGWRTPRDVSLKLVRLHKNSECALSTREKFQFL